MEFKFSNLEALKNANSTGGQKLCVLCAVAVDSNVATRMFTVF